MSKYKQPWQMTSKEFAKEQGLPVAKEGNVIVYHVLANDKSLDSVLEEGILTSKKKAGGEGPSNII
jgi:hypothetical protein